MRATTAGLTSYEKILYKQKTMSAFESSLRVPFNSENLSIVDIFCSPVSVHYWEVSLY